MRCPGTPHVPFARPRVCLLCGFEAFSPARHRALADCEVGMWVLTETLPATDRTVFAALRETAATPTVRVWATSAPFEAKDQLRTRGYRWMASDRAGIPRSWWMDVTPLDFESEFDWLADVYRAHGRILDPTCLPQRQVSARDRWRTDPLELSV